MLLRWWKSKLRIVGRRSERFYLRLYPNPGFMIVLFGWKVKWSSFRGFQKGRI